MCRGVVIFPGRTTCEIHWVQVNSFYQQACRKRQKGAGGPPMSASTLIATCGIVSSSHRQVTSNKSQPLWHHATSLCRPQCIAQIKASPRWDEDGHPDSTNTPSAEAVVCAEAICSACEVLCNGKFQRSQGQHLHSSTSYRYSRANSCNLINTNVCLPKLVSSQNWGHDPNQPKASTRGATLKGQPKRSAWEKLRLQLFPW